MTIKTIQMDCLQGKMSIADAVSEIDSAIGGIMRIDFKDSKIFKITNHDSIFPLNCRGIKKKWQDRLYGLAVHTYFRAKDNGSIRPGELHISRKASTKHHMDGIYRILSRYGGQVR